MKKLFPFFLLFLLVGTFASAQVPGEKLVPKPVLTKFATEYPGIKPTRWEVKAGKKYEAVMIYQGRPSRARYAADGTPLFLTQHYSAAVVPANITSGVLAEYNGFKVDWANRFQNFRMGTDRYLVHFSKPGYVLKVWVNADGTVFTGKDDDAEDIDEK